MSSVRVYSNYYFGCSTSRNCESSLTFFRNKHMRIKFTLRTTNYPTITDSRQPLEVLFPPINLVIRLMGLKQEAS